MRIAVVDYHKGNLKSVERGLVAAGAEAFVTDNAADLAHADALVLPGVGAFADASASMQALGQMEVIRDRVAAGIPFLGICLGMHLLFEEGVEGSPQEDDEQSTHNAPGLAILPGVVTALPRIDAQGKSYKIPHVGWNSIDVAAPTSQGTEQAGFDNPLLEGIQPGEFFYFTHGYVAPDTPCTVATTAHSIAFPSVVAYKNAFGAQFHPEKSSDAGAVLLRNFVNIVREG
ncbi:MAG: imidazole glycerol phosphate synthase subunit HisH [Gordonibacter sp.]